MKGLKAGDQVSFLKLREKRYVRGHGSKGKASWVCDCVCGTEVIRREDFFKPDKVMSCGCQHPSRKGVGEKSVLWKGCGELGSNVFGAIRCGARKRQIEFNITIEQCWEMFQEQESKCALTGLPLQIVNRRKQRNTGVQHTASLDRIDSMVAYNIENVWWVHKDVNMMKKEYSLERFREICRLVTEKEAEEKLKKEPPTGLFVFA